jgi:hypothetical protein
MTRLALAFACLVLLAACPGEAPASELPTITRACYRSFAPTLAAWEAEFGRAPVECSLLDTEYTVQLATPAEIPCVASRAESVIGCITYSARAIYLLDGRDERALTDSSVHEWVHALAHCADGDGDGAHLRAELWALYGAGSVEVQALAGALAGECL